MKKIRCECNECYERRVAIEMFVQHCGFTLAVVGILVFIFTR